MGKLHIKRTKKLSKLLEKHKLFVEPMYFEALDIVIKDAEKYLKKTEDERLANKVNTTDLYKVIHHYFDVKDISQDYRAKLLKMQFIPAKKLLNMCAKDTNKVIFIIDKAYEHFTLKGLSWNFWTAIKYIDKLSKM